MKARNEYVELLVSMGVRVNGSYLDASPDDTSDYEDGDD